MKENIPDISFERSMNHNYMILSRCSFFGKTDIQREDYRTKMLLENRIPGLLPVTHRLINGESRYYYEINSLQSLDRLFAKTEIRYDVLRRLLLGCVSLFERLEEYLLDGTQIIIKPDLIYIDVEKMDPYFVCYPDYEGDVRMNFMEFIDELLTRIDHTDEHAVMLGYQIYRYTRNPNYVISEIGNMIEHAIVNMANGEMDTAKQARESSRASASYSEKDGIVITNKQYTDKDYIRQSDFDTESCKEKENTEKSFCAFGKKTGNIHNKNLYRDFVGGIFCVFVALCAGAIVIGARLISTFHLGEDNELYLCGAMGMALMAAILFFSCYRKKKNQAQQIELLDDGEENQYYTSVENESDYCWNNGSKAHDKTHAANQPDKAFGQEQNSITSIQGDCSSAWFSGQIDNEDISYTKQSSCNETVYLGDCVVEERMLCGRMNGREVHILLNQLPLTVGKLAAVSDFVINDTSVSKMHARFEERNGRVYICDLNSTNGTVHNGELLKINQSVMLEPGDRLRFGRTSFTYC